MTIGSPQHIIFDIGGVVVRLNFEPSRQRIARQCGIPFDEVQALMTGKYEADGSLTFLAKYVLGQISTEAYLDELVERFGNCISRDELIADCADDLPEVFPDTADLIARLAESYSVSCFSNTHDLHWQYMLRSFPVFEQFEQQMASHLAGVAKPLPTAYEYMCKTLDCAPEQALLIDDSKENIKAAREFGMHGLHFVDIKTLKNDLSNYSIML